MYISGVNPSIILIALIVLAVVFLIAWGLSTSDGTKTYYRRERLAGSKGGKVKRVITEYEDDEVEEGL